MKNNLQKILINAGLHICILQVISTSLLAEPTWPRMFEAPATAATIPPVSSIPPLVPPVTTPIIEGSTPPVEPPTVGHCEYYSSGILEQNIEFRRNPERNIEIEKRMPALRSELSAELSSLFGDIEDTATREYEENAYLYQIVYDRLTGDDWKNYYPDLRQDFQYIEFSDEEDPALDCVKKLIKNRQSWCERELNGKTWAGATKTELVQTQLCLQFMLQSDLGLVNTSFTPMVFDADCKAHVYDPATMPEVCQSILFRIVSPISLIWEKGTDIENGAVQAQFQLDPRVSGQTYTWKASGAAPLLVYDPESTGKITSATQLFGEWAFGGKKDNFSKVSLQNMKNELGEKWESGYEALAQLDFNRDGKVSGPELEGISLWFDYNRDAVSQEGEVKTLSDVKVTALYYNISRQDPKTKSIFADTGFERTENGITVKGSSVDWFGGGDKNAVDLANKNAVKREICS